MKVFSRSSNYRGPLAKGQKIGFAVNKKVCSWLALFFIFIATLMAGCAMKSRGTVPSPAGRKAEDFTLKGLSAYEDGNYEIALRYFSEALRLSRSIEERDSSAMNLNNIATVYHALGKYDEAHRVVDEILGSSPIWYSSARRTDAAVIKTLLFIDSGELESAVQWAEKALLICGETPPLCTGRWRLYNLKGRALLLNGEHISALDFGARGYWLSKKNNDRREEADALRVMAESRAALGEHDEAERLYRKALVIDKDLGLSREVFLDLMGIGYALQSQGRQAEALNYFLQALLISDAEGDEEGAEKASSMLEELKKFK